MVYDFEVYRPSNYSRLYSYYYPTTSSYLGSYERPYNSSRYYKPYWSYNPYNSYSNSSNYRYSSYRPSYRYDYAYGWPYHYTYSSINPRLPTLSAIMANDELDRAKRSIRAKSLELDDYNFGRSSSVSRFARASSLERSTDRYMRSSLERDLY